MASPQRQKRNELSSATQSAATGVGVQSVVVSADEAGMRVDRFLEARFPGLSFSHIQRIIRKGELRVNGRRAQPKQKGLSATERADGDLRKTERTQGGQSRVH